MEGSICVNVPYLPQDGSYLELACNTAKLSVPSWVEVSKAVVAPICDCIHTLFVVCHPDRLQTIAMSEVLNLPSIKRLQRLQTLVLCLYNTTCPLEHLFLQDWLATRAATIHEV
jgi:hypothetical protein